MLIENLPSTQLQTQLQTPVSLVLKNLTDKDGITTLSTEDSMGRTYQKDNIAVPCSIKEVAKLENNRVVNGKAKLLLRALDGQNDQQDAILKKLAKRKGYKLVQEDQLKLNVVETIALRDWVKTPQNGVKRLDQFLQSRLDLSIFPPGL